MRPNLEPLPPLVHSLPPLELQRSEDRCRSWCPAADGGEDCGSLAARGACSLAWDASEDGAELAEAEHLVNALEAEHLVNANRSPLFSRGPGGGGRKLQPADCGSAAKQGVREKGSETTAPGRCETPGKGSPRCPELEARP